MAVVAIEYKSIHQTFGSKRRPDGRQRLVWRGSDGPGTPIAHRLDFCVQLLFSRKLPRFNCTQNLIMCAVER